MKSVTCEGCERHEDHAIEFEDGQALEVVLAYPTCDPKHGTVETLFKFDLCVSCVPTRPEQWIKIETAIRAALEGIGSVGK